MMNIKSTLNKPFFTGFGFENITGLSILVALLLGIGCSLIIIAAGMGAPTKIAFIGMGVFISYALSDINTSNNYDRNSLFKKCVITMLMTLFIMEAGLFMYSDTVKYEQIKTLRSTISRSIIKDNKEKVVKSPTVVLYSYDNNNQIDWYEIGEKNKDREDFYMSITGRKTIINYAPFFVYNEETYFFRTPTGETK